jgi:cytochrome P450
LPLSIRFRPVPVKMAVVDERPPVIFNPYDRSWWAQPYRLYRDLLEHAPTGSVAGLDVLSYFARHEDCLKILRDPAFGADRRTSTLFRRFVEMSPQFEEEPFFRRRSFLFLDPPDHTRLRALVVRSFTPPVVQRLRPRIDSLVESMLSSLDTAAGEGGGGAEGGGRATVDGEVSFDAVSTLAYPLPVAVICALLGVPLEDRFRFGRWSRALVEALDPELIVPHEVIQARLQALADFDAYFAELIAERRAEPSDDLVSSLALLSDDQEAMSDTELLATLVLLLVAGHETTVNLIGNSIAALAAHPEQWKLLRQDPSLVPQAVEEVLRWDPPVQLSARVARQEVNVGGVTLAEGDIAMLLLGAANRDPGFVTDPERFDVTRGENRHLAFGMGAHHCVGATLARAEAAVCLTKLLERFETIEIAGEPRYRETLVLRGIESLPVVGRQSR